MKLCACGCGQPVGVATYTIRSKGIIEGQPLRFRSGHTSRTPAARAREAEMESVNPTGRCMCGCGKPAPLATKTRYERAQVKGQPVRFIVGHQARGNQYNVTHGCKRDTVETAEYRIWKGIIQRCTNPNRKAWPYYGGRGITVCDRWRRFENFLADMGMRPLGQSIDRIDNDGNYEPANCRWATAAEQRANRRDARQVAA